LSNPSSDNITITVTLIFTGDIFTDLNEDYELSGGDSATVSFLAGETEPVEDVIFRAVDDNLIEGDRVLIVSVATIDSGELNDSADTAEITIIDNDLAPTITIDDNVVVEGDDVEIPIYLLTPAVDRVELEISFMDIDTDGDFDTTPQTVVFEAGSIVPSTPLIVTTIDDNIEEPNEDFGIMISNVIAGTVNNDLGYDSAIVTIQNDDVEQTLDCVSSISRPSNGQINVSTELSSMIWVGATSATGYQITVGTTSGGSDVVFDTALNTSYVFADSLEPGTTYYVNIIPFNDTTTAEGCVEFTFTTEELPEGLPDCATNIEPEPAEIDVELSPYISWDSVENAEGYFLSVGTSVGGTDVIDNVDVRDNTSYLILDELESETVYYISVYPYNSAGTNNECGSQFFVTEIVIENETKYGLSPNGDGINEFWVIDNIESYPNNEVFIYNRWGSLVYHTFNYDNTFNVFKGEANQLTNIGAGILNSGTYFYEIKIDGAHDLTNLKGFLVLKR